MNVQIVIQARMASARFPGKVLAPLGGRPAIDWIIDAAKAADYGYPMVVTTAKPSDAPLVAYLRHKWVEAWDGPENDVLGRFQWALSETKADTIVRLTADCPRHSPDVIRRTVAAFRPEMGYLFSHWLWPLPKGHDVEVFSRDWLEQANREATDPYDREHVCPWMRRKALNGDERANLYTEENLCLDTLDDYRQLQEMPWPSF